MTINPPEPLLSPRHVAAAFGVDPQTVARWAKTGKLTPITTLGGHRRYGRAEIHALLTATSATGSGAVPKAQHRKENNTTTPDHDAIARARLNALAAALTTHGLRVRIGTDALTVRNPTPHAKDTSPNPGRYQAITIAPDHTGTPTWHWAWTDPHHDTRLRTQPIAPADDITTTAATIARALGTRPAADTGTNPSVRNIET